MAALKGKCEDGCGRDNVWVAVRRGWDLLCDDCARARGVLYR